MPPETAAEVESAIDDILDGCWQAPEEPYIAPAVRDCMDEYDRVEVEGAARLGWEELKKKSKQQLEDAKRARTKRKTDIGRSAYDFGGRCVVDGIDGDDQEVPGPGRD